MAEPDKRPVTLEELLVSSLVQTDALAKLLIEKWLITREEFMQKILEGTATYKPCESYTAMTSPEILIWEATNVPLLIPVIIVLVILTRWIRIRPLFTDRGLVVSDGPSIYGSKWSRADFRVWRSFNDSCVGRSATARAEVRRSFVCKFKADPNLCFILLAIRLCP